VSYLVADPETREAAVIDPVNVERLRIQWAKGCAAVTLAA
jgi:hypothetical protein